MTIKVYRNQISQPIQYESPGDILLSCYASPQDASPQDASPQDASPQDASPQDASPQDASPQINPDFDTITSKEEILLSSLVTFYGNPDNLNKMLPIIHGQSNISLRILDWFITNFSKKCNVIYKIDTQSKTNTQFNVYIDYKSQLKAYSKRFFDPFCRRHRVPFICNNVKIITTIGQLNFFRWAIKNNILVYVSNNLELIENNMNDVNKNKVKQYNKKKNVNKFNIPLAGSCDDISISATKIINKHDVRIMVTFE